MTNIIAYVGLGANLDNPILQLQTARHAIAAIDDIQEVAFSSVYRSPPMGPQDQPDYVNAVMKIHTTLSVSALLLALQYIENTHGRVRLVRWGARTLDLDILLYGDTKIDLPELIVPHVGMKSRAFVLYPLFEIAPDLIIDGQALSTLIEACPLNGLERLAREF